MISFSITQTELWNGANYEKRKKLIEAFKNNFHRFRITSYQYHRFSIPNSPKKKNTAHPKESSTKYTQSSRTKSLTLLQNKKRTRSNNSSIPNILANLTSTTHHVFTNASSLVVSKITGSNEESWRVDNTAVGSPSAWKFRSARVHRFHPSLKSRRGLHRRGLISATRRNFPAARDRAERAAIGPFADDERSPPDNGGEGTPRDDVCAPLSKNLKGFSCRLEEAAVYVLREGRLAFCLY